MSWWPKQSIFLKSGLWHGYWSPQCEEWFQGCLCQIWEHTAQLMKSTKWPSALKYSNPKTKSVVLANATTSEVYLKRLTKGPGVDLVAWTFALADWSYEWWVGTCIINFTSWLILNLFSLLIHYSLFSVEPWGESWNRVSMLLIQYPLFKVLYCSVHYMQTAPCCSKLISCPQPPCSTT